MAHHSQPLCVVVTEGVKSASVPFSAPGKASAFTIPANENLKVKADWMTPAEALQAVQRIKRRLQDENLRTHALLKSENRRRIWDEVLACEECLRWQYFRINE